ncbi:hypothetical protein CXB51_014422 [Gossypium anomalum]|uniref:Uncharacterized protein n=1 Tax=Gossypium anomalum TaxID=47600 RepID=A0A8J5YZR4_9ROSI|nr:hypothetical protein CXB51_014422 [Gossypium anomalum]
MFSVRSHDMHFVYVLPGWEGSATDGRVLQAAISRRHGLKVSHSKIVMSSFSQSIASSQNSRGTKKKWVLEEDLTLVAGMVDLYNVGTYNADTRFKADYLNELERIHKIAGQCRHRNFPYYAQTSEDIVEEIDIEDVANANSLEEGNNYHGCKDDVSLDEMDVSATQSQLSKPNQDSATFSKKKKKIYDGSEQISTSISNVSILLGENIRTIGLELSRSIASEKVLQERDDFDSNSDEDLNNDVDSDKDGNKKYPFFNPQTDMRKPILIKALGLIKVISVLFPTVEARNCARHIYNNFKNTKGFQGQAMHLTHWKATKATFPRQFEEAMSAMRSLSESTEIILEARDKPILTMLEIIKRKVMTRLVPMREAIEKYPRPLCPMIHNKLSEIVIYAGNEKYEVDCGLGKKHMVNLFSSFCSCRKWDLSGISFLSSHSGIEGNVGDPITLSKKSHWYS